MTRTWPIAPAWTAAAEVTAAAYGVEAAELTGESRGRGPKPREAVIEPRKIAIFAAVAIAGCPYAAFARHAGLHKDTVQSHCTEIRNWCAVDAEIEARIEAIIETAIGRLKAPANRPARTAEDVTAISLLMGVHARLDRIEAQITQRKSHPTKSDETASHPTISNDHALVIIGSESWGNE